MPQATSYIEAQYDALRMLTWQSVIPILVAFLFNAWPRSERKELLVLDTYNRTDLDMALLQRHSLSPGTYCWLLLIQHESAECPFIQLLFHSLLALPVYNLALILIGWHLNKSASYSAERIVLVLQPIMQRSVPDPPVATTSPMPPLPPPRSKRRKAPKPPLRQLHRSVNSPDGYPSQKDPFATIQDCYYRDQYNSLRRNLKRVLEGLQQPLPPIPPPAPPAITVMPISDLNEECVQSPPVFSIEQPKNKAKSRKLFRSLFKRLGKSFVKRSSHLQDEVHPSIDRKDNKGNNKSGILHPIWQRFKFRSSHKPSVDPPLMSASSSSVSSNCSSHCLYAS